MEHEEERHVYLRDYGWIPDSYRSKHAQSHQSGLYSDMVFGSMPYEPKHRLEKTPARLQVVR